MSKVDKNAVSLLVLVTFLWASSFILIKIGLREIPPVTLAALRFLLASAIFLAVAVWKYHLSGVINYLQDNWLVMLAIGFTGIFLPNVFQNWGMQYTTAYVASIIQAMGPIFTAILATIFLGESLGPKKAGGALLALFGAVMISSNGNLRFFVELTDYSFGNLLLLGSAISYGFYTVISKAKLEGDEPLLVVTLSTVMGTILLLITMPIVEPIGGITNLSFSMWLLVIALAIFPTAIAYFLWFEVLKKMEASKSSFFIFLIPVFTTILAWLVLSEAITLFVILNAVLILFGVVLANLE